MNWDWSKILIAVMAGFILFIVVMGIQMVRSNQSLYESDYYEQGQNHADRMKLEEYGSLVGLSYNHAENRIEIQYDSIGRLAKIKLVNLSSSSEDRVIEYEDDDLSSTTNVVVHDLANGIWMMEVSGFVNGHEFFKKQQFVK